MPALRYPHAVATFTADYRNLYDQAGMMVFVDDRTWLKAGTEFTDDLAGQPSPTCGHVYRDLVAGGAAGIDATSRWEIRWSGGGQSAFRTMALTSSARLPVREIRTLNTRGAR